MSGNRQVKITWRKGIQNKTNNNCRYFDLLEFYNGRVKLRSIPSPDGTGNDIPGMVCYCQFSDIDVIKTIHTDRAAVDTQANNRHFDPVRLRPGYVEL